MEFKDYYTTLGVKDSATHDEIKRAYRKLARKFHPDVSKEVNAEAQFKEVAEAYEALNSAEKRAAYDDVASRHRNGQSFNPPPGWDSGFEFSGGEQGNGQGQDFDRSDFFEALFGRHAAGGRQAAHARMPEHMNGEDRHAKVVIDLEDAYRGGRRSVSLHMPVRHANGQVRMQEKQLDINIPKGIRAGQHLRLSGQGELGHGEGSPGDLYLEIQFAPHHLFRVEGRDLHIDIPVAPWEAALGGRITLPTLDGDVQLTVPPGSSQGRKLRLKGKGLPSTPPGDLYAVLSIVLPPVDTELAQKAWQGMATSFSDFKPRQSMETP